MAEFASKGVANTGLGLGIAGTAGWLLNGGLSNIFGGGGIGKLGERLYAAQRSSGGQHFRRS